MRNSEEAPLVGNTASVPEPPSHVTTSRYVVTVFFLVCMYIGLSATLINYNKFLMSAGVFPFPVALTWLHMGTQLIFSVVLYAIFGKTLFPSMDTVCRRPHRYFGKVLPIALCFGGSIVLSNEAYVYCSVPFLQMCKELNIVFVYLLTIALALDKYNPRTAAILLAILFGCSMGIEGELNYSRVGFMIQMGAQVCEVFRIVIQQNIMQGQSVDPLTMVLMMSPLCLLAISTALYTFWTPEIIFAMQAHWNYLLMNCLTAYALNITVATLISTCSGVAFILSGVVKDILIVVSACFLFHASVTRLQVVGFVIAVIGVGLHSLLRLVPEVAEKNGLLGTLQWLLCGTPDVIDIIEKGEEKARK